MNKEYSLSFLIADRNAIDNIYTNNRFLLQ